MPVSKRCQRGASGSPGISIDGLMPSAYTSASSPAANPCRMAGAGVFAEGVVGVLST